MNQQRLFYVDTELGCGIRAAANLRQAERDARSEVGTLFTYARYATPEDVAWVKSMGGHVPEGEIHDQKELKAADAQALIAEIFDCGLNVGYRNGARSKKLVEDSLDAGVELLIRLGEANDPINVKKQLRETIERQSATFGGR